MQATAHSKTTSSSNITITAEIIELVAPPNKESNKWPATMLAASRTARAPGRIRLLTVSMTTIKAINAPGVPGGTR